jgi:hypothetical protein
VMLKRQGPLKCTLRHIPGHVSSIMQAVFCCCCCHCCCTQQQQCATATCKGTCRQDTCLINFTCLLPSPGW